MLAKLLSITFISLDFPKITKGWFMKIQNPVVECVPRIVEAISIGKKGVYTTLRDIIQPSLGHGVMLTTNPSHQTEMKFLGKKASVVLMS